MSASIAPQPFNQRKRLLVVQGLSIAAIGSLLFSRPGWDEASTLHELIEMTGFVLILVCIFGRLWSILYVGGRKNTELAVNGPYSITRNPLYLFSMIGAFGIGLMFGSIIVAVVLGVCTYAVFGMTARKEEAFLLRKFGPKYEAYAARTPRFWPKLWLYQRRASAHVLHESAKKHILRCPLFSRGLSSHRRHRIPPGDRLSANLFLAILIPRSRESAVASHPKR